MRASEILRGLADIVAKAETEGSAEASPNQAVLTPVSVDHEDHTDATTMIPPLQQKQEMLKKMAGVENVYNHEGPCEACGQVPCGCEHDELDAIKKNAGIQPAAVLIASVTEPFEG